MSHLSELIRDLCPDGVDKRPLGELLAYTQPGPYLVSSKKYSPRFPTPVLTAGTTFLLGYSRETDGVYEASKSNPVIIFDDFTTDSKWVDFPFKLKSSAAKILTLANSELADIRFLFYSLQTIRYEVGTHSRHWISRFAKMSVFCPPLEVQQEIVRVLDQFTTLEAELEAELEARSKQYKHYRDSLLSFHPEDRSVRWVSIGDVSDVFGGLTGKRKGDFGVGDARYASYRNVYSNIALDVDPEDRVRIRPGENQRRLLLGDLVLTGSSESRGEVGMSSVVVDQPPHDLYLNSFCIGVRWRNPEAHYPNFVKHLFRSGAMRKLISCSADGVTRFNLSKRKLKKIVIPIPLIEEQRRIADILDRFDALVNDISSGLPAEIVARRKQYEYYRNMVLTFPERRR